MIETAMPAWRKMLGSSPDLAEPLYFLSKAYVETGRFQDGEKAAQELVAVQEGKVAPTDQTIWRIAFSLGPGAGWSSTAIGKRCRTLRLQINCSPPTPFLQVRSSQAPRLTSCSWTSSPDLPDRPEPGPTNVPLHRCFIFSLDP